MANDTEDKKHFPTREEIIEFIDMSPTPVGKREIARAFNIKGAAKIELKNPKGTENRRRCRQGTQTV